MVLPGESEKIALYASLVARKSVLLISAFLVHSVIFSSLFEMWKVTCLDL